MIHGSRIRLPYGRLRRYPTAQTSFDATPSIAVTKLSLVPGLGVAAWLHAVPLKCMARLCRPNDEPVLPTAQTSLAENALTALNVLPVEPGVGTAIRLHAEPLQRKASATSPGPLRTVVVPTANA